MINIGDKVNKSNLRKLIDIEIASLNASLDSQKALSKQILSFLKNFIGNLDLECILSDDMNDFLASSTKNLKKINSNISVLNNLLEILNNIKFNIKTLKIATLTCKITQYNEKSKVATKAILKTTSTVQTFIQSMTLVDISEYIALDELDNAINAITQISDSNTSAKKNVTKSITTVIDGKSEISPAENTLIISETNGIVSLPYKVDDLKKILKKEHEKYSSFTEIIQDLYTKPLSYYKHPAISRFKEAYKLVTERDNGSKKEAFKLATELFSNYNLHPAIITACKDLNELDVYLACLELNELEDFHFFNIVYEALPVVTKSRHVYTND